jgi:hypothetical protein
MNAFQRRVVAVLKDAGLMTVQEHTNISALRSPPERMTPLLVIHEDGVGVFYANRKRYQQHQQPRTAADVLRRVQA